MRTDLFDNLPDEWRMFLADAGVMPWESNTVAVPYLNHGRWLADCTCGDAMRCVPGFSLTCCLACGAVCPVLWSDERDEVEALVSRRPPSARNYNAARGETLDMLRRENLLMLGREA